MPQPPVDWSGWTRWLADELSTLADHEFVNTWGPTVTRERSPGLFGRRRKPLVVSAPVVRFLRTEDHLLCESVNPYPAPDEPAVSEEQRDRLHTAGWLMSGDDGYEPMGGPFCRVYLPMDQASRAAELAATTYQILGLQQPEAVEWERNR